MHIHIHHHDENSKELVQLFFNQNRQIMADLKELQDQVAKSISVQESAITLISGLKAQLDAAIASEDPAALQALSDQLGAEGDKLAASVAANTPAQG